MPRVGGASWDVEKTASVQACASDLCCVVLLPPSTVWTPCFCVPWKENACRIETLLIDGDAGQELDEGLGI